MKRNWGADRLLPLLAHAAAPPLSLRHQSAGLKSKRFTKAMLAQMRRSGEVRTVPAVRGKSYGYRLEDGSK